MYAYKELFNKNPKNNGYIKITDMKGYKIPPTGGSQTNVKELGQ